jgi:hypothetical protein
VRQSVGKRGFTHAGNVLNQQVAACEQAAKRQAHLPVFAQQNAIEFVDNLIYRFVHILSTFCPFETPAQKAIRRPLRKEQVLRYLIIKPADNDIVSQYRLPLCQSSGRQVMAMISRSEWRRLPE